MIKTLVCASALIGVKIESVPLVAGFLVKSTSGELRLAAEWNPDRVIKVHQRRGRPHVDGSGRLRAWPDAAENRDRRGHSSSTRSLGISLIV